MINLMSWIILNKAHFLRCVVVALLFSNQGVLAGGLEYADEEEKRRVNISLSVFPRIVAVDNNFRSKLNSDKKVRLLVLYDKNKVRAQRLVEQLTSKNKNIGGMNVTADISSVVDGFVFDQKNQPTAIFLSERLGDVGLSKVMTYAEEENRIVFSPFVGDVERGVTVGISVTNRVKPYFNLPALKRSKVDVNALLMKMSKRYE